MEKVCALCNIEHEQQIGLHSIWLISCDHCSAKTKVDTERKVVSKNGHTFYDINTKTVFGEFKILVYYPYSHMTWFIILLLFYYSEYDNLTSNLDITGVIHAGLGCAQINEVLMCLNMPKLDEKVHKRYEREIGPAIEEVAK